MDMKLEVVAIPVSDVDRAKHFYKALGWREDADFAGADGIRKVQLTPPGSPASVHFGTGVTSAAPGSAQGMFLVVRDIEAIKAELTERGAVVSDIFHVLSPVDPEPSAGPHPDRGTYSSYATFSDPDGNTWLLQEVTKRLPGRVDTTRASYDSVEELAEAMRQAEAAHGEFEKTLGHRDEDWPTWYAHYMAEHQV
jgi:catechol 2,3-dioxygenase-like lactoylglutathione lyase family enzyme